MKRWLLHIWLIGVLVMLAASCSQEVDGLDQETDGKVQVMFTIALDNPSTGSRATWGDNYDNNADNDYESAIGNDFDNRINPDQLFVTLTIGSNTYNVKNIAHWQTTNNVYEFVGEVDGINQTNGTVEAKIQVYANMSSTRTSTFEPDYKINQTTGFVTNPNGVSYIPMWGVQTTTISLIPGERNDLTEEAPIYLLRAMAKVEVNMNVDGYTLTNVTLNKYNTQGNCLPAGATTLTDTKSLHYDNEIGYCFNPNTTSTSALSFNVTGNHLVFYLPEVANGTKDTDNELYMTVTLQKGGQTVTLTNPYLYFRNYDETSGKADNATPFDIVRNHWYQYNITKINNGVDATLKVKAIDWDEDEEIWDYKEQPSVETSGKMQWNEKQNINDTENVVTIEGTNVYIPVATNDKPAECKFRISTPVGASWHASFDVKEGSYSAFRFLDASGNEVASMSGKVGEEVTLRIITTNTTPTERSSAVLRIVTNLEGRTNIVKQLVPGMNNAEYTLVQSQQ